MASRPLVAPAVMDHGIDAENRHMGDYRTKLRGKRTMVSTQFHCCGTTLKSNGTISISNTILFVLILCSHRESFLRMPILIPGLGILPGISKARVTAGWPIWFIVVAGEAIKGWIPRWAVSFEKLDEIILTWSNYIKKTGVGGMQYHYACHWFRSSIPGCGNA